MEEPVTEKPVEEKAEVSETKVEEPVTKKPVEEKAEVPETKVEEPVTEKPVEEKAEVSETKVEEPVTEKPVEEKVEVPETKVEEPVTKKPVEEKVEVPETKVEEPVTEKTVEEKSDVKVEASTDKSDAAMEKFLRDNGVDMDKSLELLGDMEMYNMTLGDFISDVVSKWARINQYKEEANMHDYAIEVHSLKSDCKYLGFMKLADISYQHELKSKEEDVNFVNSNFEELTVEYNKVIKLVNEYIAKFEIVQE